MHRVFIFRVAQIFQGWLATSFFYGEIFYVRRRAHLGKPWLRKAIIATIPFHAVYLTALFWSDHAFPQVMTKAMVFIPVLALGFAFESVQMGRIIDRFRLTSMKQESGSPVS